jgi:hypothetical protein
MKVCSHCQVEYKAAKSTQKYCSNTCRVKAFNAHKNANLTPKLMYNNDTMNEQINAKKIIDETVERILMERQQVFETKLKAQEAEYNNKLMELRLSDLEKKVRDLEKDANKDEGGFGISMPDMVNAAATYFATKMSNTPTNETTK